MKDKSAGRGLALHLPDDPAELAHALDRALHVNWLQQPCDVLTARVSERRKETRLLAIPGLLKLSRDETSGRFEFSRVHPDGEHVVIDGQKLRIAKRESYDSVVQLIPPRKWEERPEFESLYFLAANRGAFEELVSRCLVIGQEGLRFEFLETEGDESVLLHVPNPKPEVLDEWTSSGPNPAVSMFYQVPGASACIEWGYDHPWASRFRSDRSLGFLWVINGSGRWRRLPVDDLRDIYELVAIDAGRFRGTSWKAMPPGRPFPISLTLVPRAEPAPAEMWILPAEGVERLERLFNDLPEEALAGLSFARYEGPDAAERLVLHASVPGPVRDGLAFAERKFASAGDPANLMLPIGYRLSPIVRPESLASVFGVDDGRWSVLDRGPDGSMKLLQLGLGDFEPMSAVTRHVIDAGQVPLQRIMARSIFEFEQIEAPAEKKGRFGGRLKRLLGGG